MANLSYLIGKIDGILQDPAYTETIIADSVNAAISRIAAGIRMPDGQISPPLPDLYTNGTVTTSIIYPYVSLPTNYQRKVTSIYDSTLTKIPHPSGGDYYSFNRFISQITNLDLSEVGDVYIVSVKGTRLYYQGIPSAGTIIGLHYYRKPTILSLDGDVPDCIPDHLQEPLIKHFVCKEIMGERIEDGQDNTGIGTKYHTAKFFEAMIDLMGFIGIDAEPMYYGSDESGDAGVCDG